MFAIQVGERKKKRERFERGRKKGETRKILPLSLCFCFDIEAGYGFKSLANFYFLRFLLPAVTSYGSLDSSLKSPRDFRSYLAVSKVIQCIANNTLPESSATIRHMSVYVESKSNFMETFFFNLITARTDDSVCELNSIEFNQADFDALRVPLLRFMLESLPAVRTRLGPSLQLHSWLGSEEDVQAQMQVKEEKRIISIALKKKKKKKKRNLLSWVKAPVEC